MKIGSLNIRGLGAGVKKKKICSLISAEKLDSIAIQETKMGVLEDCVCQQLWGGVDYGCCYCPARRNSGWMISLWDANRGSMVFSFT